jgi:hypothetical protein
MSHTTQGSARARLTVATAAVTLACLIPLSACGKKARAEGSSPSDPASILVDAYVYGYPLVTMDQTRRVQTNVASPEGNRAPMGQFANLPAYPDASYRDITAPNANTLYSVAWLDLSTEPYVLSLPAEHGRYYLMPMLSGWTDVITSPGKRTTGTAPQRYVIAGPDWNGTPNVPGAKLVTSPTNMVWLLGRTFAQETKQDIDLVHGLQNQYRLVPLSAVGKSYMPPPGQVDPSVDMKTAVRDQVNALDATTFFNRLALLMKDNPPAPADSAIVARMASIGIVAGHDFDATKLDGDAAELLNDLPKRAQHRILSMSKTLRPVNGWLYATDIGRYGTNYDLRAYIAAVGLGANLPQDAIYPATAVDATGRPLEGSRKYVMHFGKGRQPPVKGFWSLTMYDAQMFFVANPLNRYQISPNQSPVTTNPDGSLDIYIQHDSPGADREKNWLPTPTGHFALMLRMYWPDRSVLDASWKPPAVSPAMGTVSDR